MENENITLEEHRSRTVGEIIGKLDNNDRVCCVRYTGYGKTYYLIKRLIELLPDKQFLIFVPSKSLIRIYNKIFCKYNVIIKTYQSLLHMNDTDIKEYFYGIDYVICDEAHRLGKNKWRQSIKNVFNIIDTGNTKIIGFTATPKRGDKIDITEDFFNGVETSRFDLLDGIQAGYIPKIDYVVAYCDLSGLDKEVYDERMEDVDRYDIDKLLNVSNIIKENIDRDKLTENLKVVLYVPRIKDIDIAKESCNRWFTEAFPDKNIKIFSLSSEYTDKENDENLDKYSDDESTNSIDIMISCNKLNEGLHLPKCSVAILLRKTVSPIVYFQQIGRAINGTKPVIFDLVDNSSHISHTSQIRNDYINDFENTTERNSNKDKETFSMCVNLIDIAKDLENILYKYKYNVRVPDEIRIQIANDAKNNNLSALQLSEKYNIGEDTVYKIFKEFNIPIRHKDTNMDSLKSLIMNNLNFIQSSAGKLTKKELAERLNIPDWKLLRGLKACNIEYKGPTNKFLYNKSISQNIKNCFNDGLTYQETADKLGMKYSDIRKYCKVDKIKKNQLSSKQKQAIIKLYKSGNTISEISKLLSITGNRISRFLKQENLYKSKIIQEILPEEEVYICNLYETKSYDEISKITGYGVKRIRTIIKRHGLNGLYKRTGVKTKKES